MEGGSIFQNVSDDLIYDTLHFSEDNLWSVLLMAGYITKADSKAESGETVSLKIPNKEIAAIFEETVVKMFRDTIDKCIQMNMMEAMWNIKESDAGEYISKLLMKTISYNDYKESYYLNFLPFLTLNA